MMSYNTTITKEEITDLPVVDFKGEIREVSSLDECNEAVLFLQDQTILGFDTETRPSFKKGILNKVALIQLSTKDVCFLFRLNKIGFPDSLVSLLSNKEVRKIGISLKDDFQALRRTKPFTPNGFVDIQQIIHDFGIQEKSLQKIFAILFHQKISKSQRLTNWESNELTDSQKKYAAIDAWACLEIFNKLLTINKKDQAIA